MTIIKNSLKLSKVKDKTVRDKTYYRYRVSIPLKIINDLGWDENTNVKIKITKDGFMVTRS